MGARTPTTRSEVRQHPGMELQPPEPIPIIRTSETRAATGTTRSLERAERDGELARIRHGAYAKPTDLAGSSGASRHLALIEATRAAAWSEPLFCHESAAALHGIPVLGSWPGRARITVPVGGGKSNASVQRTQRALSRDDVVVLPDGIRVTSPIRTAIDLAADRSALSGIVAMSHVREAFGIAPERVAERIAAIGRVPGLRVARAALARSTSGSESALESIVIARCQDLGFADPDQQFSVRGVDGDDYRVDFAWDGGRVLGEADGRGKYFAVAASAEEVLWREKQREDAIRPTCDAFVRVTWDDAWGGAGLERRLLAVGVPRVGPRRRRLTF